MLLNQAAFTLQFEPQVFFAWQLQPVTAREYLLVFVPQHITDDGIVLLSTENQSHRWIVIRGQDLPVIIVHIHLHLPEVSVVQFVNLEIDYNIALEPGVIEDQVRIEMIAVQC